MRFETDTIHAGHRPDKVYGALSAPIYQTSTFAFEDVGKTRGFDYSRSGNPTRKVLGDTIAKLEGGRLVSPAPAGWPPSPPSFMMKNGREAVNRFLRSIKVFTLAESLGGMTSLAGHPVTQSHASRSKQQRENVGITEGLVRLSVGLENADDLLEDLKQALKAASVL